MITTAAIERILHDAAARDDELEVACEAASDISVIDDDLACALLGVVRDGGRSNTVRARAAIALGPVLEWIDEALTYDAPFESPISRQSFEGTRRALRETHDDADAPTDVRRAALEASIRAPEQWHRHAVEAAWAHDDPRWRMTAVFCMRWIDGFESEIVEALTDDDADVRHEAVTTAVEREVSEAIDRILDSGDEDLIAAYHENVAMQDADLGFMEHLEDDDQF